MPAEPSQARRIIARGFSLVEDAVFLGLGLVLAIGAVSLLVATATSSVPDLFSGDAIRKIIPLLDRILLILLVVELLYTVQVSFREHVVTPEPFLLVGLIAAIRRVLILTAEVGHAGGESAANLQPMLLELGVLTLLIVAIATSLYVLGRRETASSASRK